MALEKEGLILRSGAAPGADQAFEAGIKNARYKEIFIPWDGFEGKTPMHAGVWSLDGFNDMLIDAAESIARLHHPRWDRLTQGGRRLQTRNSFQVLGRNLNEPSLFVVCWTPGGSGSGGTGQAIRVANRYGIPVFDLGKLSTSEIEDGINALIG